MKCEVVEAEPELIQITKSQKKESLQRSGVEREGGRESSAMEKRFNLSKS